MLGSGIDPQLLAKQADTSDLVRFKQEMDGLKDRLAGDSGDKSKQLRQACQSFEAVFISKMWQEMRNTVPKDGYTKSKQEEMYLSMFDKDFAEKMAQAGGIGLADMIYEQLSEKLKETSREALPGAVEIRPLKAQPIAMGGQDPIALNQNRGKTLEDWGGSGEGNGGTFVRDVQGSAFHAPMTDVDVKARLEALTRRLDAERIREGLVGESRERARTYGRESGVDEAAKVGRSFARNG
ncbi:flagellar biosynthesis protein FlgJ [Pseudodesulfovibrio sp. F-1]|uniref:Flagellar biosynthesis protein FlgJ n=1 Tax=Pseudodesulfovibrio alkaliphilus TaxID=2661613 RepID=A0A7K1KJ66_9BACT|nr:rod-binding protein [Pseudodesulfovibrio alkaliphilus]MUM76050.1 flagellar biosynthesis protein FlgJ [Pseudodesulfovibrio alkaliphilus]